MADRVFERRLRLPVSAEQVFAWHARPGAFERLTPPWRRVRVLERRGRGLAAGSRLVIETPVGPIRTRWVAEHTVCEPPRRFVDVQREGPFAFWEHEHRFEDDGPSASTLVDRVTWRLPTGPIGAGFAASQLERLFARRHAVTLADLERHAAYADRPRLRVAVSGASGLVGSALCAFLESGGHEVRRLTRRPGGGVDFDLAPLDGVDAVVHLAGENIAGGRWTEEHKRRIVGSRVEGTGRLARAAASLSTPPRVFVSASAIGFYGDSASREIDESAPRGAGFLAETTTAWEDAAAPAPGRGIRTVLARFGVVLSPSGGALQKMLTPFLLGGGGPIGSGRQGFSWIALDDVVGAIHFVLMNETLSGPVNVTAPNPVSQRDFAHALGRVVRRPSFLPLPAAVVQLAFGEMGEAMLLGGAFVVPRALERAGFAFRHPELDAALRFELGR
ncbi:MAG TPA: TIGR01777 family oxidoreductase [Candidatus Polarisedimenticolaceae bacterium]